MSGSRVTAQQLRVVASDGFSLGATRYADAAAASATIIVAGATGVQQRFYRRFAEYAATDGYDIITFDYRGVGESAPTDLRGFEMDYGDWARRDLSAIIDEFDDGRPIFLVGHSYGGVAFGLCPNIDRVAAIYSFGAGAGWHGWMSPTERVRVLALWHVVGPVVTRAVGYLPGSLIGLGSDMPLGVYRDWKRWAGFRRFFFDDPLMAREATIASEVRVPVVAATAIDDAWAPPRSRDALMSGYVGADVRSIDLDPHRIGLSGIGHSGYFRANAAALWNDALDWIDGHRSRLLQG